VKPFRARLYLLNNNLLFRTLSLEIQLSRRIIQTDTAATTMKGPFSVLFVYLFYFQPVYCQEEEMQPIRGVFTPLLGSEVTFYCTGRSNRYSQLLFSWVTDGEYRQLTLGKVVQRNVSHFISLNHTYDPSSKIWTYDLTVNPYTSVLDSIFQCEMGALVSKHRVTGIEPSLRTKLLSTKGSERVEVELCSELNIKYIAFSTSNVNRTTKVPTPFRNFNKTQIPNGVYKVEACFSDQNYYPKGCTSLGSELLIDDTWGNKSVLKHIGVIYIVVAVVLLIVSIFFIIWAIVYEVSYLSSNINNHQHHDRVRFSLFTLMTTSFFCLTAVIVTYSVLGITIIAKAFEDLTSCSEPPSPPTRFISLNAIIWTCIVFIFNFICCLFIY
jgi:hypothetical protein